MNDNFFVNLWHKTFVSSRVLRGIQILGYPYPGIRFTSDNVVELFAPYISDRDCDFWTKED